MTQASLSPDPLSSVGFRPAAGERPGVGSEAALWLFGLTSLTLVLASLLLLALLAQNAVADAPLYGFLSAAAVAIALVGVAALAYVVAAARRAGYLQTAPAKPADPIPEVPAGLRVVTTTPADPALRKRRQQADAQASRSRQAKAIAAVEAERHARTAMSGSAVPTPVRPRAARPQCVNGPVPAPVVAPVAAAAPALPSRPVPVRPAAHVPARAAVVATPPAEGSPPTPAPVFPRMPAPIVRPRTQVTRTQLVAADIRAQSMRTVARAPVARPAAARPPFTQPTPFRS